MKNYIFFLFFFVNYQTSKAQVVDQFYEINLDTGISKYVGIKFQANKVIDESYSININYTPVIGLSEISAHKMGIGGEYKLYGGLLTHYCKIGTGFILPILNREIQDQRGGFFEMGITSRLISLNSLGLTVAYTTMINSKNIVNVLNIGLNYSI